MSRIANSYGQQRNSAHFLDTSADLQVKNIETPIKRLMRIVDLVEKKNTSRISSVTTVGIMAASAATTLALAEELITVKGLLTGVEVVMVAIENAPPPSLLQ